MAKTYGRRVQALRGIEMQVHPGEVFGLLGPNGAGKSTLVKIMMTVIRADRAGGTILGRPIGHRPTLGRVGYLPEHHRFPPYLTGRQALEYYAALANVDRPTRKRRAMELLEIVRMQDWADARLGTYSKGMQQRVGLAQALVNDPQLVVLDEPTDGLDPVGRREVRELLGRLRDQGKTVFLNSHLLSEVEMVCDRVAILLGGRVVRQGTIDELTAGTQHYELELGVRPVDGAATLEHAVRAALGCQLEPGLATLSTDAAGSSRSVQKGSLPDGLPFELDGPMLRIASGEATAIQPVLDALRTHEVVIHAVRPVRQSLEDLFVQTVSASEVADAPAGPAAQGATP